MAPPNFNNCSFRDRQYYFLREDRTEAEWAWSELQADWVPPPQYREPDPVIPEDSEEEETFKSEASDIQTLINPRSSTRMSAPGPTDPPLMTTQSGRGKLKLPDNYSGDRTQLQKFLLLCLLLFTAELDRYKTNDDKISLVLSCMRYGTASVWAKNFLKKTIGAKPPKDFGTWDTFKTSFELQFHESNVTDKA